MTNSTTMEVFIVMKEGPHQYYLLKVIRSGLDVYCIPPHLGVHYSVHESGEAHFRVEGQAKESVKEPPVVLMDGEAGTPIENGIIRAPLADLGRASCICTACYPINSLSRDFQEFKRKAKECFVVGKDSMPKDADWVEIGVWAVPERNKVSFEFNVPNIPVDLLYKVAHAEPQIWVYARPFGSASQVNGATSAKAVKGGSLMTLDRMNKRECPTCHQPLSVEDENWLARVVKAAEESQSLVMDDTPRTLACGHRASAEAASFGGGKGFWLVPRQGNKS